MRNVRGWIGLSSMVLAIGCGGEYSLVDERDAQLAAAGAEGIDIAVGAGQLDVVGEPGLETVSVHVELRHGGWGSDDAAAIAALDLDLQVDGDRVRLDVPTDDLPGGYFIDVEVRVPSDWSVSIDDSSGDIVVGDVAAVDVRDDSGELAIARVPGAVEILDDTGNIELDDVGPVSVEDGSGEFVARRVDGDLDIVDDSGEISASDVAGDATIRDGSGGIEVVRVRGTVTVDDDSGDIVASDVGDLVVASDTTGEVRHR